MKNYYNGLGKGVVIAKSPSNETFEVYTFFHINLTTEKLTVTHQVNWYNEDPHKSKHKLFKGKSRDCLKFIMAKIREINKVRTPETRFIIK